MMRSILDIIHILNIRFNAELNKNSLVKILTLFLCGFLFFLTSTVNAQEEETITEIENYDLEQGTIDEFVHRQGLLESGPVMVSPNYQVEKFVSGLEWPTTMTFIENDLLVLEKNKGTIRHIKNGILQDEPVLNLKVDNSVEGGLLGIVSRDSEVFLFFTEANSAGETLGDKIYKYVWDGKELKSEEFLMKINRDDTVQMHHGGVFVKNMNDEIFVVTGDSWLEGNNQNNILGNIDDTGAIFDITKKGEFHAIGIRNSFGLAVDHITNNLWITENGPDSYDEINLMLPKSNSGWSLTMGPDYENIFSDIDMNNKFTYSDPEFSWEKTVGVTAISFVDSKLFPELNNSILAGDFNNGNLYKFELNENRNGLEFKDESLTDLVANTTDPINEIIFGVGFPAITDIEIGPDGMIYVVTIGDGSVYRISPVEINLDDRECDIKTNIEFFDCDFSNLKLDGINLSGKTFKNTNFSNSSLTGSLVMNSEFTNSDFSNSILKDIKFQRTSITNSIFEGADLSDSDMRQVIISNSNFESAKLNNVNLERAIFEEVNMGKIDVKKSNLLYAKFKNVILSDANIEDSNLESANILQSNLQRTNFENNNIRTATFTNSDLSGAKISGLYPYSSEYFKGDGITFSSDTEADVCLGEGLLVKILNRILYQIRQDDSIELEFLERIIINAC